MSDLKSSSIRRISLWTEIRKSFLVSIWFMVLTFPLMVIRVNTTEKIIQWRWANLLYIGLGSFFLSILWRYLLVKKETGQKKAELGLQVDVPLTHRLMENPKFKIPALVVLGILTIIFPLIFSTYQINILITALMYVMLGLGLNIVVGLAGLLNLGYVSFYAVGAYSYALLNHYFPNVIGFWVALPIGAAFATLFGILLGFPVLRLRGDYLAIVTLGFGEIIRLVLENWNDFSFGPSGISKIARPGLFGLELDLD
ncbi:MAG: branched-chain amino acid ABC transporter permease, partial [Deltaproteobacteria bacterium]|nr:branched-chain amino acid ABC transporter permease [Deltaproteobacteria bacterium]